MKPFNGYMIPISQLESYYNFPWQPHSKNTHSPLLRLDTGNINHESTLANKIRRMANYAKVTLQDIPDIASDTLERLQRLDINSVYQLAVRPN